MLLLLSKIDFQRDAMGKAAAASPVKKSAGGKAATNGAREPVRAHSFDDSIGVERVERVESTIVNRETATHVAFAKRYCLV